MKRITFKIFLLAALGMVSILPLGFSQQLGGATADAKMVGGSPSASQGMGSLYSPNLYDGSANINIPIYQYSVENNNFGISFGYNTKGAKLDEVASDIGFHWTIEAGASITRVQKDLPDEINLTDGDTAIYLPYTDHPLPPFPGYSLAPGDTVSLNEFWGFKGKYASYFESPTSAADQFIYRDNEADDFIVNLGSGTFTFNLGKNGTIFTHPHRGVTVEVLWNDLPMGSIGDLQPIGVSSAENLLGFRIRDEQGNSYLFTRSDFDNNVIEDSYARGNPLTFYASTSKWVVSEVTLANGGKIKYNYSDFTFNGVGMPVYNAYAYKEGLLYPNRSIANPVPWGDHFKKLQNIQYPNGITAYFYYDAHAREDYPLGALQEIKITGGQQCLSYVMKQSFFYSSIANHTKSYEEGTETGTGPAYSPRDNKYRLKLDAILLNSCDSTVQEPYYSFQYDTISHIAERLSPQQDFYGYYNTGVYYPTGTSVEELIETRIPYHHTWFMEIASENVYGYEYGMDKRPNYIAKCAAMLTDVINAYGGRAKFYYGEHTGLDTALLPGLPTDGWYFGKAASDGLRLDSIVESEQYNLNNKKTTVFEYSGGQLFMPGGYCHFNNMVKGIDSTATNPYRLTMTGSYLTPHQLVNGSNHGYSNVNVITRTGSGALLSRKEIKFSNFKDNAPGSVPKYIKTGTGTDFYTYPYTNKQYLMDWAMGLPLEITEYDQNNRIVQKTINKYRFTLDTISAKGKVDNQKIGLVAVTHWVKPGTKAMENKKYRDFYHPYTGAALLDTTIVRKYLSDNAFLADTVRYHYDSRNNMDIVYARNSKGQETQTRQVYNYTVNSPGAPALQQMTQAGLEKLVGTERWITGSGGVTTDKLIDAFFNTFDYNAGKLRPKYLYNLQTGSLLSYSQYTGYTGGPPYPQYFGGVTTAFTGGSIPSFVKTSEVTLADLRGNPLENRMLGQNLYKSMIWDTLTGQKIAEANARYTDIAYSGFEATVKGNWEYNQAGVSSVTDALAGDKGYFMPTGPVSRSGLTAGKAYSVAFWVSGTAPSCTIGGNTVTLTSGPSQGNWTYYEGRFTAPSSASVLSIASASNMFLDELRLFPADAGMQSWSYKGMFGVSAETSVKGRVTYYEYDKLGRQTIVRDQDRNILSKTEQHIAE